VLNQFDKFFSVTEFQIFSSNTPVKNLRKTGSVSSLVSRKLSKILLTNFLDVFFEEAFVKQEAFSWVNRK